MIKLGRVDKILTLSLRIFNGPKAFPLFNWDMNLCTSSWLVALGRNEFNELFLRKFLNDLFDVEVFILRFMYGKGYIIPQFLKFFMN